MVSNVFAVIVGVIVVVDVVVVVVVAVIVVANIAGFGGSLFKQTVKGFKTTFVFLTKFSFI